MEPPLNFKGGFLCNYAALEVVSEFGRLRLPDMRTFSNLTDG